MRLHSLRQWFDRHSQTLPLRSVLVIPFVLQIVSAVGLVGYLSYRSGQQAIEDLAQRLIEEVGSRIDERLSPYLATPHLVNQLNLDAVTLGQLEPNNFKQLQQHFWRQKQAFGSIAAIYYANERGEFFAVGKSNLPQASLSMSVMTVSDRGVRRFYFLDDRGSRAKQYHQISNYDPRSRPWYQVGKQSDKATWSPIFNYVYAPLAGISAVAPLREANGKLKGVFVTELLLTEVSSFLNSLKVSRSGQAFIVERGGEVVATSTLEKPFFTNSNNRADSRRLAMNSSNPLTRDTTRHLIEHFGDLKHVSTQQNLAFVADHHRNFVRVTPFRDSFGLDWLTVVVVPEADFMAQIHRNSRLTLLLCGATLLLAIAVGLLTARWLTHSIARLNAAAKNITQGKFDAPIKIQQTIEFRELATSFNQMAAQLQASFQNLSNSEKRVKQILEALPVGVAVHRPDGSIAYLNQTGSQILGPLPPDASLEQLAAAHRIYRLGTDQPYPWEQLPVIRSLQGESVTVDDLEIHRVGKVAPLEVQSIPVLDDQGTLIYSIVAFQDITERKAAERVLADYNRILEAQVIDRTAKLAQEIAERKQTEHILRQERDFSNTLIQTSPAFYVAVSAQGQTLLMNDSMLSALGYTVEEVIGTDYFATFVPEADRATFVQNFEQQPQQKQRTVSESYIQTKDGQLLLVEWRSTPIWNEDGSLNFFFGLGIDVTERRAIERMKTEFISIVSHELRTPLTAIRGSLGLVATGIYDNRPEKARRMIEIALNDSERLVRLVNDILDLERLDSDRAKLEMRACEVAELMQQAVEGVQSIANEAGVRICVTPISAQVWASADAVLQTLTNLLSNAIKFSPSKGTVWLSAEAFSHQVRFAVKDQGRGIPADKLEIIFQRFQQVDVSDSRRKGGTGLGLAICQSIVQQHNGKIWAESKFSDAIEDHDRGSTFYFTLPTPSQA